MDFGIRGRTALVTGGSKGMGRDVARMLAAEGCRVAVVARTKADIDDAVASIREQGGTAVGITADMTDGEQVRRAVAEVREAFGPPSIVIGQTKFTVPGDFADIEDVATYTDSFQTYTVSQVNLLHAVLPAMRDAGWGRFVHIGSATAKEPVGNIHHAVANATRPSTIGLLKTVSDEYARYGITVNTVAPGWIETQNAVDYLRANAGVATEDERRSWMLDNARVPAARMGRSDEIASLIVYLCSAQAGYVTGNWIEVDGGHHRSAF
ncbi:SDR family oxidoreductase [Amycolatopsis acidiphila]|uniref:SDR family oxidoreductase n=1 Tax=Amycolatopsis acidiphila TaxID=715473 RepID=A0A558AA35_9PSEU|nr:SDR family oxidoreductase [Amycolatopsis acidiphila]TVT21122.1 SDR family oxidoreductase [Amycolatopsis acidiphila]UIJ57206.1 SDR family oxidoreductase [Amycolatopsis acidiphila]GHG52684.1 short-chain dehydrogenase [Amycolatopsis acidiphila]